MERRACQHCHTFFSPLRNPQQRFCSHRGCQNVRKALWRRARLKNDPDYRENHHHAYQRWRKSNLGYWKSYRDAHPSYTNRNREKERQRRLHKKLVRGARESETSQVANRETLSVAKCDALTAKTPFKAGTYELVPVSHVGVAKCDALIVEISVFTGSYQQMGGALQTSTL
jgi:S-methylmethionine-dependent homocysteine/selenocysteine methylase